MKYKAAIFDLDGTTLDTLDDLAEAVNYALGVLHLPLRTAEEVRGFAGNGVRKLIERATPECSNAEVQDSVYQAFSKYYAVHCADHTRPYKGIAEAVLSMRQAGMKSAIVSNKDDYAVQELVAKLMPGLFDYVAGVSGIVRPKPAPDAAIAAMKALQCSAAECVYIGDSEVDIETARNAHLPCISVTWGFKTREFLLQHGARAIAESTGEMLNIICL